MAKKVFGDLSLEERIYNMEMDVSIPFNFDKGTYRSIYKDNMLFNDGNEISTFISTIITSYYDEYMNKYKDMRNKIKGYLTNAETYLDEDTCNSITWKIINDLQKGVYQSNISTYKAKNVRKNVRIKKDLRKEYRRIISKKPKDVAVTQYFESIIYSYLSLPSYKREQIIFKDTVTKINEAIQYKNTIHFRNVNGTEHDVLPISIEPSQEEIYSYLVYQEEGKHGITVSSVHIRNIIDVDDANKRLEKNPKTKEELEKMELNGYQFPNPYHNTFKVRFSNSYIETDPTSTRQYTKIGGKELFDLRYLERPAVINKDGNVYEFNCSSFQLENYLAPFFKEAIIIEPENEAIKMIKKYEDIIQTYQQEKPEWFDEDGKLKYNK